MNSSAKKKSLFETEDELSEREKDVVKLICQEFTNNEIGENFSSAPELLKATGSVSSKKLELKTRWE